MRLRTSRLKSLFSVTVPPRDRRLAPQRQVPDRDEGHQPSARKVYPPLPLQGFRLGRNHRGCASSSQRKLFPTRCHSSTRNRVSLLVEKSANWFVPPIPQMNIGCPLRTEWHDVDRTRIGVTVADTSQRFTADDLDCLSALVVERWRSALDRDW